jgi:hypothetical protein
MGGDPLARRHPERAEPAIALALDGEVPRERLRERDGSSEGRDHGAQREPGDDDVDARLDLPVDLERWRDLERRRASEHLSKRSRDSVGVGSSPLEAQREPTGVDGDLATVRPANAEDRNTRGRKSPELSLMNVGASKNRGDDEREARPTRAARNGQS